MSNVAVQIHEVAALEAVPISASEPDATLQTVPVALDKPIEETHPRPAKKAVQAGEPSIPAETPPVIIKKENGHRFEITGETIYELDASAARLREGTVSDFTQQALKEMIKTPADLSRYWSNIQTRQLLTDQLAKEALALDALTKALNLPDVDHFDLLQSVLFQQPTITRAERVQRLRAEKSAFFQRFESNPLAKELLDTILDKYSRGDAPDVSNLNLLDVQPLKVRTRMEWSKAFSQGPTKTSLGAVLKELQQLLYSV